MHPPPGQGHPWIADSERTSIASNMGEALNEDQIQRVPKLDRFTES
ncbi:hypothetical protein BH18ACT3_BH18ACT3_28790 [soil metagenome]|jgi:hypothetical protein